MITKQGMNIDVTKSIDYFINEAVISEELKKEVKN
jgi:hypothetical protein